MGAGRLSLIVLAACASAPQATESRACSIADRVAADFEKAVLQSRDAYVALFDFVAVGEYEILLHRYDLDGRLPNLEDDQREQFSGEDGTPYPEARERRNVGNFYDILAQRTVGSGGCSAAPPRTRYGRLLGVFFDPLPQDTPPGYEKLRTDANAWLAKGGVVGVRCIGGKGGLAIVYTARDNGRGYDLITIYDD
jgi:hypothetical protein